LKRREEAREKALKELEEREEDQEERRIGHSRSIRIFAKETQ
jgi:hypothetical protein